MTRNRILMISKVVIVLTLCLVLFLIGKYQYQVWYETLPSFQKVNMSELYPNIEKKYTIVLLEDELVEMDIHPKIIENKIYLPVNFVTSYINSDFYWDENEQTLTYTTQQDVIRMQTDELTYFVNDEPLQLNFPITLIEEEAYIPTDLLLKFDSYHFTYNETLDLLMIEDPSQDRVYAKTIKDFAYIRLKEDVNSPYIKRMDKSETVEIIQTGENWFKVKTDEGYIGYVKKEELGDLVKKTGEKDTYPDQSYQPNKDFEGKVNLVWHQVTNVAANSFVEEKMEGVTGVDVLSPTWFEIIDQDGTVSNIADQEYVRWAHNNGYQVWALFKSFNSKLTHEVLKSTAKREKVIKQILALSSIYELDGINIDFENVNKEDGEYFVQFVKEITPYLKNQGLVVSVDMYVPAPWTVHYNRKELGKVIDFLIIMGYDEHWSTSPVSGSVASIGFVEDGIKNTILEVPKEKIILGLPYYTRLWMEKFVDGQVQVSSQAYSMNYAYELLVENDADIQWNNEVGQYYGEYFVGDILHRIWLEEERSIEEKVKLVDTYGIAGVAGWKLGLEKEEVWDVLKQYLK